jgi:adenylate cyclase
MIFSIQKRFLVLLLIPVILILFILGIASFLYARSFLLDQWNLTTKLGLEKTAHQIRMRLDEKREMMELIASAEKAGNTTQSFLLQELKNQKGVLAANLLTVSAGQSPTESKESAEPPAPGDLSSKRHTQDVAEPGGASEKLRGSHDAPSSGMKAVSMNAYPDKGYLRLETIFPSRDDALYKKLTVTVSLDYLVQGLLHMSLWQGGFACLVDADGAYLAHSDQSQNWPKRLGQTGRTVEEEILKEMKKRDFGDVFGQGSQADIVMGYYRIPTTTWYLLLSSPKNSILAPVLRFRYGYLSAVLLSVVCIGLIIRMNTKHVASSISEIAEAAEKVEQGDYTTALSETRSDEIGRLRRRFNRMVAGLKQKEVVEKTFGRYIDKKIAHELLSRPEALHLGGQQHVVTILVADLRGFTPMAKKLEPEQVIRLLNRFFSRMISVIEKYRGIIVDFYGDSVLVFFDGIEPDVRVGAANAVKCATEMQHEMALVSLQNLEDALPALSMGIGIHTGEVIVGNIGSETRAKYGIVGSAVNETDRIQSFAEGGKTMISQRVYGLLSDLLVVGPKCEACLKGLEGTLDLYEVKQVRMNGLSQG